MADRAQPEFVDALVLIVNTLRPTWKPVARGYIERDAGLLDATTLARRADHRHLEPRPPFRLPTLPPPDALAGLLTEGDQVMSGFVA